MSVKAHIALVGDHNPDVVAHDAIPKALALTGGAVEWTWVHTSEITDDAVLAGFDAIWAVPASPYANMEGALSAIRFARESGRPFLGTCGGYQHAVLEFAQNVLGHAEAGNAEVDPECKMPVVGPLTCALVEVTGDIRFVDNSKLARIHGATEVNEGYHCSYGVMAEYLPLFDGSAMRFTGFDGEGDPRAFELDGHPFFIGTAYQPERRALSGGAHPIITEFVASTLARQALAA